MGGGVAGQHKERAGAKSSIQQLQLSAPGEAALYPRIHKKALAGWRMIDCLQDVPPPARSILVAPRQPDSAMAGVYGHFRHASKPDTATSCIEGGLEGVALQGG